ncbi:MAG: hypothetical protein QOE46_1353 [Acidobacteriota bacterium]|jgi:hypothetical protein|nr:hypothetical protein [Acidobacteriota bacterium]
MRLNKRSSTLAFCTLLLAFAACNPAPPSGGGATTTTTGDSGKAGGAAVVSANDDPLNVMTRAMRAQLDAKSYRTHMDSSTSNGTTSKLLVEYVAPDRYRMVTDSQADGKNFGREIIIIGKDTYMKTAGGQWMKSPVDMGSMINSFRDPKVLDELTKGAEIKFVGPDLLDGMPMLVYTYTLNNPAGSNLKSVSKTWVAVSDGLPRKTETEGEFGGIKSKTVATISDYNGDIKIEPPGK